MKKHLYIIALIICLLLTACGTQPPTASSFETDSITVYDITMGGFWEIKDEEYISGLAAGAQVKSWVAQTALEDQISAAPNYALDFGNGTCIGLLGDGYILAGTAFEYLSEDHQSYRIVDGCQYQVPVDFTNLLKEFVRISPLAGEVPAETEEVSTEPEEIPVESEEISVTTSEADEDDTLESLMTDFMNGGLEGCLFNDGSEASEHFRAWSEMLGGEEISLVTETPQSYWESWCAHVENLYAGNGYDYFVEQDYPVSAKYIELKYGIDG